MNEWMHGLMNGCEQALHDAWMNVRMNEWI